MATTFPYILTHNEITIVISGAPYSIAHTDSRYHHVMSMIKEEAMCDDAIVAVMDRWRAIRAASQGKQTGLVVSGGDVTFNGRSVTAELATRILWHAAEGVSIEPLERFTEKLYQNVSARVVEQLFGFMSKGKMAITPDGDFLAYKRVNRADDGHLVDCHTGKIRNDVGTTVRMERNQVNDDPDVTCSYGLHACSYSYLAHFSGDATIIVKINPANVVSIPKDYNSAKLRCCEYYVVSELNTEAPVLSASPVIDIDEAEEYRHPDNQEADAPVASRWEVHEIGPIGIVARYPARTRDEAKAAIYDWKYRRDFETQFHYSSVDSVTQMKYRVYDTRNNKYV